MLARAEGAGVIVDESMGWVVVGVSEVGEGREEDEDEEVDGSDESLVVVVMVVVAGERSSEE
jgi:hypothetical protein